MTAPVRLRLSRAKGFDLQSHSLAVNGLPAVNCARPGKWGNPFACHHPGSSLEKAMDAKLAVQSFRSLIEKQGAWSPIPLPWPKGKIPAHWTTLADVQRELRGKNVACWCALDAPCHADVLLELANRPICEASP